MCMACQPLIKAIDAYLAKADGDLADALEAEGYAEPQATIDYMQGIEDDVAEALVDETDYFVAEAEKAADLETFAADIWPKVKLSDTLKAKIATIFSESLAEFMPEFIGYYIAQTDRSLKLEVMSKRTTAWVKSWSEQLGEIMQLNSHKEIETILTKGLQEGVGIASFTRKILNSGIRDEYYKARRVAVTEVLTAHRVAQQEAFMQSPAVTEKAWKHTGAYRNEPRQNHVDMDGQRVPKGEPYELTGADGTIYHPMEPGDTILPPEERINCHCISQPIVDDDILGLPLEERRRLQQEAIDNMDDGWEKELDSRNRAKAGITIEPYSRDISRKYTKTATPGEGKISFEEGYDKRGRKSEVEFAEKLKKRFGGDILLLNDRKNRPKGMKSPDYEWRGLFWELKEPQSSKQNATSDNFRAAKRQIIQKPGGVIFNYTDDDFEIDRVINDMLGRFSRKDFDLDMVDVMIFYKGDLQKVIRFEK